MTSLSGSYTPLPILRVAAEVHLGPPTQPPGGPDNYLQLICPQLRGPGRAPLRRSPVLPLFCSVLSPPHLAIGKPLLPSLATYHQLTSAIPDSDCQSTHQRPVCENNIPSLITCCLTPCPASEQCGHWV